MFFNPNDSNDVWITSFGGGLMQGRSILPTATATQVNDGSIQRSRVNSLRVTFNEVVTLTPNAFAITGPGGNSAYTIDLSQSTATQTIAILNFAPLNDGLYSLNLPTASVSDIVGQHPSANYSFAFHRLFGDADGDRSVSAGDFIQFRLAFGGANNIFDFDNDGSVSAADFVQFRLRFGGSI